MGGFVHVDRAGSDAVKTAISTTARCPGPGYARRLTERDATRSTRDAPRIASARFAAIASAVRLVLWPMAGLLAQQLKKGDLQLSHSELSMPESSKRTALPKVAQISDHSTQQSVSRGIDGVCPTEGLTFCPCKEEWSVRYQYPGAPTEESINEVIDSLCTQQGLYGTNWVYNPPRSFADFSSSALAATDVCCDCGGGVDCSDSPFGIHLCQLNSNVCARKLTATRYDPSKAANVADDERRGTAGEGRCQVTLAMLTLADAGCVSSSAQVSKDTGRYPCRLPRATFVKISR
eukprot:Skav212575  [mRNA]  locus=scaffold125:296447:310989:- [translate_table: standard]